MNNDNVKKWLAKKTFHNAEFKDLNDLIEKKKKLGVTIGLCFPTLNEEKTIGKEVIIMRSELMERYPLLDEIAVIDSGSTDKTLEIAKSYGAKTFLASDHLKDEGPLKGKGENLWKALHLLESDIIVYVDADISNIHAKFVYGLVGPMLNDPETLFVKGFYERPIEGAPGVRTAGGGRVTEILVRPLFSQFFPELCGLIQPLSGEYAGYRKVLETLRFPIGYGVETGMMIDIYQNFGLNSIAQADLDQRIHQNQAIHNLGNMSFGILQTFWDRAEKYGKMGKVTPESLIMQHIEIEENIPEITNKEIKEIERKPMIEVEEYRKKRGLIN